MIRGLTNAVLLSFLLAACDGGSADTAADAANTTADTTAVPTAPAAPSVAMIRADGIGAVTRGMTIGQLRAALPAGTTLSPPRVFMVDINAMTVARGRDTLYHVLIPTGEPSTDDTPINLVGTMNHTFRTANGVGPGTTLADAARIYGPPRLFYNTSDESREYAAFPNAPTGILMRVAPSIEDGVFAGVYQTEGEYNQTMEYDPAATIAFVMVDLRTVAGSVQ